MVNEWDSPIYESKIFTGKGYRKNLMDAENERNEDTSINMVLINDNLTLKIMKEEVFVSVSEKDLYLQIQEINQYPAKFYFVLADGRKKDQMDKANYISKWVSINLLKKIIINSGSKQINSQKLTDIVNSLNPSSFFKISHETIISMIQSMASINMIIIKPKTVTTIILSEEGSLYEKYGTPEYLFAILSQEFPDKTLDQLFDYFPTKLSQVYPKSKLHFVQIPGKIAFGNAKKNNYVKVLPGGKAGVSNIEKDITQEQLKAIKSNLELPAKLLTELRKRSLTEDSNEVQFEIQLNDNIRILSPPVVSLQDYMIISGEWKDIEFAPLNFEADFNLESGHEHPLLKVRQEFRQVFLQMGFEEMDTSKWVENSFWNFDSLFQGQQHPCRDMHDTFFMSNPELSPKLQDTNYFDRVKEMHCKGGNGSIGLRYEFSEVEPLKNIMRTHTTAVSSRMLKSIADEFNKSGELRPRKFFSIDRVYRNETLDATHLAEFHQVEGFVLDKNLSLGDLMNHIREFFGRIGLNEIEFKPAYNPYTEPSMEIFAKHEGLGRWIEIGNSGMFRPEMLTPMNLPEGWSVIAWGFSLERPTMIEYKINEIRKLEGPNVSLELIENVPICRLTF